MPKWLFYTLLSIVLWGIWGIIAKMADAAHVQPMTLQVVSTIGVVPASLLLIASPGFRNNKNVPRGIAFAFTSGLAASCGNLAFFYSLNHGGAASVVAPLTGMFAIVTLVLSVLFLRERINAVQVVGMFISLVAVYLFSIPDDADIQSSLRSLTHNLAQPWMFYALVALVLFGLASILQKIATNHISSELSTVGFAIGFIPVALFLLTQHLPFEMLTARGWILSLVLGVLIGVGGLALFAAYRDGKASIVTALYALYPALTVALAVPLFRESLDLRKGIAIATSLLAALALSYETRPQPNPGS
jgi:transporter family protein